MIILVGPGHGGPDPGAPNPFDLSKPEKTLNLAISREIQRLGRLNNHDVYLTRSGDTNWSLDQLVIQANTLNADAVFEVHCDWSGSPYARGCHAIALLYSSSWDLARELVSLIESAAGIPARGVEEYFWDGPDKVYVRDVQRFNQLSGRIHMIVENGFVSNLQDEGILTSADGPSFLAWCHLAALHRRLGMNDPKYVPVGGGAGVMLPAVIGAGLAAVYVYRKKGED